MKINQAQLILAEKRTSLAVLRTGLALLGLPMALVSFLVAMSGHYQAENVLAFLVPLLLICLALASLGVYLCVRAVLHLHRADARLARLKNFSQEVKQDLD